MGEEAGLVIRDGVVGSNLPPSTITTSCGGCGGGDSKEERTGEAKPIREEMKATVKGRYEGDKATAAATVALAPTGDLRLRASATDAAFAAGPSLDGLTLTLEKPGAFLLDLKPHNQDVRFQFMNSATVLDKRVSLTYTHSTSLAPAAPKPAIPAPAASAGPAPPPKGPPPGRTALDLSIAFDPANKVSVSHALGGGGCRVKYTYAHGAGRLTTIEPVYDTAKNAWEFAVARKFDGGDSIRGTYQANTKQLGLEWTRGSSIGGSFKVATTFDLSDQSKAPKLVAESTWNYEI